MLGLGNNDAGTDLARLRKMKKVMKKTLPEHKNEEEWTGVIDSS